MGLRVNPYHGLVIGALLFLVSLSGSTIIVDERVVVPANGYLDWPVWVYPGQALRVGASGITDDTREVERYVLEIVIMDDENFAHYEAGNYTKIRERYQELIHTNSWDFLDVDIRWFGRVHVILNNKIRVVNRDSPKEADFSITVLRPLGYLASPSLILVGVSLVKSYKQFKKDFMNPRPGQGTLK